jgi:uncharacterized repeat protein (TIGR03837 family)
MNKQDPQYWDIFCKIIDNYGDIGVCWRLCQQLVNDHKIQVRLFIDDFTTAKKIIPQLDTNRAQQRIEDVMICTWPTVETMPAKVVIETFSCTLPDTYLGQMATQQSTWINLEYLSAETWVSDFHAKPSPHPTLKITRHFFFPGFKNDTGGLLREKNLITKRDEFLNSTIAQSNFWQKLGIQNDDHSIKISLFCYPQANIKQLLLALYENNRSSTILFPFSGTIKSLSHIFTDFKQLDANTLVKQNVTVRLVPFLSQYNYDRLLWACDLNFVRGEDSWIRAIWASKPFIWQPYIQTEETHIKKMRAFLAAYSHNAPKEIQSLLLNTHLTWSAAKEDKGDFKELMLALPKLNSYAKQQTHLQSIQADLATNLLSFSEKLAKNKV